MAGKTRPSQRAKVLTNVDYSNLSYTDKQFIHDMFALVEKQQIKLENYSHNVRTMTKDILKYQAEIKSMYEELQRIALMTVETNKNEQRGDLNE